MAVETTAIRQFYEQLLSDRPTFTAGPQRPALLNGDWALTSTRTPAGATAEVAHRQPDGTWRWVIDQPNILSEKQPRHPTHTPPADGSVYGRSQRLGWASLLELPRFARLP
jgi:hypothetical protein